MKIDELIEELEKVREEHGNLENAFVNTQITDFHTAIFTREFQPRIYPIIKAAVTSG